MSWKFLNFLNPKAISSYSNSAKEVCQLAGDMLMERTYNYLSFGFDEIKPAHCISDRNSYGANGTGQYPGDSRIEFDPATGTNRICVKVSRHEEKSFFGTMFEALEGTMLEELVDDIIVMHPWAYSEKSYESTQFFPQFNELVYIREDKDGNLLWSQTTALNPNNLGLGYQSGNVVANQNLPWTPGVPHQRTLECEDQIQGAIAPIDPSASGHRISSRMGLRVDPITKASTQTHGGVDIAAPFGTPLVAILDGTVHQARGTTIGGAPVGGFGAWVVLEHKATDFCGNPKTVYSLYGHVSRAYVRKGDIVKKGQRVADVGNEGTRTTGNHLHFEIHFDKFNTSKSSTSRQNPIDALGLQW